MTQTVKKTEKIGIYGGSFDPIHLGHIGIIKYVLTQKKLDKLIVVPVGNPSHREGLISSRMRLEMAEAACRKIEGAEVSDIEIREAGTSYTYETLMKLKEVYPEAEFYEIIGEDSADYLHEWKEYDKLIEEAKFIVLRRRGWEYTPIHPNIEVAESPIFPYSSTQVRNAIRDGRDISSMITPEVAAIIRKYSLYKSMD